MENNIKNSIPVFIRNNFSLRLISGHAEFLLANTMAMNRIKPNNAIIISMKLKPKLDRYCQQTFGKNFDQSFDDRMDLCAKEFIEKIRNHIKQAEKIMHQDYLDIKR